MQGDGLENRVVRGIRGKDRGHRVRHSPTDCEAGRLDETLALYEVLDGLPVVGKSQPEPGERAEPAPETRTVTEQSGPAMDAKPSSVAGQAARDCRTAAAWWFSVVLHSLVVLCVIVTVSVGRSEPALSDQPLEWQWRELRVQNPTEVVQEMVIPIVRPGRVHDTGEAVDSGAGTEASDETTIFLEICIDGQGNSRLVRARSERVPDGPLDLSCARISIAASPAK